MIHLYVIDDLNILITQYSHDVPYMPVYGHIRHLWILLVDHDLIVCAYLCMYMCEDLLLGNDFCVITYFCIDCVQCVYSHDNHLCTIM